MLRQAEMVEQHCFEGEGEVEVREQKRVEVQVMDEGEGCLCYLEATQKRRH